VEILLPLDRVFGDYSESILAALQKIALAEDRDISQVIDDLLMPPTKASTPGIFVGRVSKTESDPDIESRTDGTVVKKAEVRLGKEDFDKAIDAFKNGNHIKVTGTLVASSKKKTIENPSLEILERL
jgi:hypothetical protein